MVFCETGTCIAISLWLSIVLVICQVLTAIALIILYKAYADLKRKASECQKNLTLIAKQTLEFQERIKTGSSTVTLESEIRKKWEKEGEEIPTKVPTPPSNRSSGYKQRTPAHFGTTEVYRTQSSSSQEITGFPRDTSFISVRSRDSGTCSITTRSPQSSFSCESKMLWQEPLSERDFKVVKDRPISSESQPISHSQFRRSENLDGGASRSWSWGLEKNSSGSKRRVPLPSEYSGPLEGKNQNEFMERHSSRLETMAIGMIGTEEEDESCQEDGEKIPAGDTTPPSDRRSNRNQNEVEDSRSSRLQTMAIGMIGMNENGLTNNGYHAGDEGFYPRSKKTTLVSEDLARKLNSESQKIDKNVKSNRNSEEEEEIKRKWNKDGAESPTRVPTPPRNRRLKRNQNDDQDIRCSRLETMAIGMVGKEENLAGGRKNERSSREFSRRNETTEEEAAESIIDTRL